MGFVATINVVVVCTSTESRIVLTSSVTMVLWVYSQQNKGLGDFDRKIPKIRYEKRNAILGVLNRAFLNTPLKKEAVLHNPVGAESLLVLLAPFDALARLEYHRGLPDMHIGAEQARMPAVEFRERSSFPRACP